MPPQQEDDIGPLEKARERLYDPTPSESMHVQSASENERTLPHEWKDTSTPNRRLGGARHIKVATIFFFSAIAFFIVAAGIATYVFTIGGNSVSVDKVSVEIQGPTTITGGETATFTLVVTNRNAVTINDTMIEVSFPSGTRSATDILQNYPRYVENVGTLESGKSITRTIRAVLFGGEGQTLSLPVAISYSSRGSNAVFVKKANHELVVSATPLFVAVDAPTEAVSGQAFTISLTVRSNASVALNNVVLSGTFPFGFVVNSSSHPMVNSSFLLGTLVPGAQKTFTINGALTGQENEQKSFRFALGTASTPQDQTLAITYMNTDSIVSLEAPFIATKLTINGDSSPNITVIPDSQENVTVSYTNSLSTSVTNATVVVAISGAVDFDSIKTPNGFYRSSDRSVVFSRDTDSALARLAPGASGIGTFSFRTLPAGTSQSSPSITLTTSVSGTRVGQNNVPEQVSSITTKTIKVITSVALSATTLYSSGPFRNSGPIPPRANVPTSYTVQWSVNNPGSAVADGSVKTILPSYVSYANVTTDAAAFSYDEKSRTVTWNIGDIAQNTKEQGAFMVSFTPSSSQRGAVPDLTGRASFSGYDRFAGVKVSASADPSTTETKGDPGYIGANAIVQ